MSAAGAKKPAECPPACSHFLFGRCVRADPAAVFEFFPVRSSRRTFDAALPAFSLVCSPLAMIASIATP